MQHLIKLIFLVRLCGAFQIESVCGFPGEPPSAEHDIEERQSFSEGQRVTYQCIDFLSYKQTRQCHNGKWVGDKPRCGFGLDNDVKRIVVRDCSSSKSVQLEDFDDLKLDKNTDSFPNSFQSDRFNKPIRASGSFCYQWIIHLTEPAQFGFVRADFAMVFESVAKSSSEVLQVNASSGSFGDRCQLDTQRKYKYIWVNKWINYGIKYHYYFNCPTKTLASTLFSIETRSQVPMTVDLARFAVGQVYGSADDPVCGTPEILIGTELNTIRDQQVFEIKCKQPDFVNVGSSPNKMTCDSDSSWSGTNPKCIPKQSCDKNALFKVNVKSVKNVYFFNDTEWYAIEGTRLNYECMGRSEERVCVNGSWSSEVTCLRKPIIDSLYKSATLPILLPFYAIFTVLLLLTTTAMGYLCWRLNQRKDYATCNDRHRQLDEQADVSYPREDSHLRSPPSTAPGSYLAEPTYVLPEEAVGHSQHIQSDDPIYDVPPPSPMRLSEEERRLQMKMLQEFIYDSPRRYHQN